MFINITIRFNNPPSSFRTDDSTKIDRGCGTCAAAATPDVYNACSTVNGDCNTADCNAYFQCFATDSTEAVNCTTSLLTETQCYTKK